MNATSELILKHKPEEFGKQLWTLSPNLLPNVLF